MVESADTFQKKLYKSNALQHVLGFYEKKQLLEFRRISEKMAYEIVPKCFDYLKFDCIDAGDEYTFQKLIRHAKKVEIKGIGGTEEHLKMIEEIGKNQLGQTEYLYLSFGDDEDPITES